MKKIIKPSTVLYFRGKLVEVVGISVGKVIHMEVLSDADKNKCPHCHAPIKTEWSFIEDSPFFQDEAEPVTTLEVTP